jgi:Utp13 specific WD40 associated domain
VFFILTAILEDDTNNSEPVHKSATEKYKSIARLYTDPVTFNLTEDSSNIHELINIQPVDSNKTSNDEGIKKTQLPITERLDCYISVLTDEELSKIILFAKEWNENARQCFVSQALMNSIYRLFPLDRLMNLGISIESIEYFVSYSEKHYERLNRLQQASYLLEYMSSMMSLLPLESMELENTRPSQSVIVRTSGNSNGSKVNNIAKQGDDMDEDFVPVIFSRKNLRNVDGDSDSVSDDDSDNIISKNINSVKRKKFSSNSREDVVTSNEEDSHGDDEFVKIKGARAERSPNKLKRKGVVRLRASTEGKTAKKSRTVG